MEVVNRLPDTEPPRKRFKATELPLTQHQRTAIDNLVHTFKKKGQFDVLRKAAYSSFEESGAKENFTTTLTAFAESELDRNHALLGKDRKQAAPLIEGAAERKDVHKQTEQDVERMIDDALAGAEDTLRDIREGLIGKEAARSEREKGSRSDADYARESDARMAVYARRREQEAEKQRQIEAEEARRLEEERQKEQAEEEEKERQRQVEAEKQRKEAVEKEKRMAEYRALKARQDAQWEKERLEKEAKERKKREAEREKEMEDAALEELLREGKRAAERSARAENGSSSSKETALAAIMRKETLQKEKDRQMIGTDSRMSSEDETRPEEPEQANPVSKAVPIGPAAGQNIQRPTSNVWVAEGQRKPRLSYSSISIKPPTNIIPSTPIAPTESRAAESEKSDRHAYDEHHKDRGYYGEVEHDAYAHKEAYEGRRDSVTAELKRSSRRDYETEDYYHEKDYHSSSRRSRHDDAREHDYDYDYHHSHRSSRRDRSRTRSPERHHRSSRHSHSHYRERSRDPPPPRRRRSRSREHEGIDRYVPGGGSSKPRESEPRHKHRDAEPRHEPKHRPTEVDKEKKKPVEIDSYIPSTSIRARGKPKESSRRSRSPTPEHRRRSHTERTRSHSRGSRR